MTNLDEQAESVGEGAAAKTVLAGRPGAPTKDWTAASIYILAVLTLISTLNYFDRSVLSLMLPLIKAEFGTSDTTLGLVSSLILFYALFGVPIAWVAERWSRRNVIAIGVTFWSAMTALTGFAGSIVHVAVCRFFMAVGEGGGLAPSQSIISDVFSKAARPLALSIITTASSIAAIVYSPAAGWIAEHYGWRAVFVAAGIPGIVVALVLLFTVKEPKRRIVETESAAKSTAPLWEALRFLFGSRAYVFCLIGTTLMGVYLYGVGAWDSMFLVRVRGMTVPEISSQIAPVRGAVAAVGIILGGLLAARLGRMDERWRCWIPGISCLLLAPAEFVYVFAGPWGIWFPAMLVAALFSIMHQGPIYSAYVGVARPRMRAISVSIALLGATVMGQFGGPLLIGRMNDVLHAQFGDGAIRYSFLVVMGCSVLGGLCYMVAGFFIKADSARAADV